jgi:hypothetical protein
MKIVYILFFWPVIVVGLLFALISDSLTFGFNIADDIEEKIRLHIYEKKHK